MDTFKFTTEEELTAEKALIKYILNYMPNVFYCHFIDGDYAEITKKTNDTIFGLFASTDGKNHRIEFEFMR